MKSEETATSNYASVARGDIHGKKSRGKNLTCWKCGKPGHVKKNCLDKAKSSKGSDSKVNIVSLDRIHSYARALVGIDASYCCATSDHGGDYVDQGSTQMIASNLSNGWR
ncbi:hypothetical protein PIB30_076040 [Stylosanthes scabra]|uniref:CCHC-type domain-containing protein n=1 Tax=Stylosanthes scabra TaxID=79078 RepID=A0ABU6TQL4_9FABA|nr:hypothetical protein [Stylosanthes scabra]